MSDDYTGHLLEQIRDEIKAVHEVVAGQPTRGEFNGLRRDVEDMKQELRTVNIAVADISSDVSKVKRDIHVSELKIHDIFRDLDEHVHLPAHGKEMLKQ